MGFSIYTFMLLLLLGFFLIVNFRLLLSYKYWPLMFLFFYAYSLPLLSNLALEHGFYIIEQERYSFFTGSTLRLYMYVSIFFLSVFLSTKLFNSLAIPKQGKFSQLPFSKRLNHGILLLLYIAALIETLLYINLLLSPIPLFSENINRFNYWEHAKFPILKKIFGSIALPLAIIFGVYYLFSYVHHLSKLKRFIQLLFALYIVYLYLIGHKFSPQFLAAYFFFLPLWIYKIKMKIPLISKKTVFNLLVIIVVAFLFILHQYQFAGVSNLYGGAILGILYRIFVLQGHVYWGIDELVFIKKKYGVEYLSDFFSNKLDGLLTLMYIIGPSNLQWYLDHNVRFTAGYPALVILFNPYYAVLLQIIFGFITGLLVIYTYNKIVNLEIYKSIASILLLFNLYYGLSMADFRFVYSPKFLIPLIYLLLIAFITSYQKLIRSSGNVNSKCNYSNP